MAFYDSTDAIYGVGVYGSPSYGVVTPDVLLAGVSATVNVASVAITGFEIDISERLASVSSTLTVGTLQVNIAKSVSGVSATASAGTVEAKPSEPVSSVFATASLGSIQANIALEVSGVSATIALNDNWDIRSIKHVPVVGVAATGQVNGTFNFVVTFDPLTGVSGTALLGAIKPNLMKAVVGVTATGNVGTLSPADAITTFTASAYDRRNTVHVVPNALVFRSVDTGAAATAFDRTRMVTVLPKQTSQHRRAA